MKEADFEGGQERLDHQRIADIPAHGQVGEQECGGGGAEGGACEGVGWDVGCVGCIGAKGAEGRGTGRFPHEEVGWEVLVAEKHVTKTAKRVGAKGVDADPGRDLCTGGHIEQRLAIGSPVRLGGSDGNFGFEGMEEEWAGGRKGGVEGLGSLVPKGQEIEGVEVGEKELPPRGPLGDGTVEQDAYNGEGRAAVAHGGSDAAFGNHGGNGGQSKNKLFASRGGAAVGAKEDRGCGVLENLHLGVGGVDFAAVQEGAAEVGEVDEAGQGHVQPLQYISNAVENAVGAGRLTQGGVPCVEGGNVEEDPSDLYFLRPLDRDTGGGEFCAGGWAVEGSGAGFGGDKGNVVELGPLVGGIDGELGGGEVEANDVGVVSKEEDWFGEEGGRQRQHGLRRWCRQRQHGLSRWWRQRQHGLSRRWQRVSLRQGGSQGLGQPGRLRGEGWRQQGGLGLGWR